MRRTLLSLLVALLAFGIGSFVAFKFCWKNTNPLPIDKQKAESNTITTAFGDNYFDLRKDTLEIQVEKRLTNKVKKTTFTCNEKLLSAVLTDLKKDKDFNESAKYYLEENNPSDCRDILFLEKSIDLNNDKNKDAIVRGKSWLLCGATGNCSTWIYGKFGNKYKRLLDTGGETLDIKRSSTNGYKDIFLSVRDSCCSSYLQTYKFDGVKYKEGKCLFEDYGTNGERVVMTCAEKTKESQEQLRESELKLKNP